MAEHRRRERGENNDEEHLQILSICFYVLGGLAGLCALFPVIHLTIGIALVTGAFNQQNPNGPQVNAPPPDMIGWIFIIVASMGILIGWLYAIGMMVTGFMLRRRRRYIFCLVMAGLACLQQPLGTALGIFTFLVLLRPSVKKLFAQNALPPPVPDPDPYDSYPRLEG